MNIEEQLISSFLLTGDISRAVKSGLTASHFLDPINRRAYEWIASFSEVYKEVPTPDVFFREFPDYPILLADDLAAPDEYLVDQLHVQYRRLVVETGIAAADAVLDSDIDQAAAILASTSTAAFEQARRSDIDVVATRYDRLERYRLAATQEGLLGISTGLAFLDAATMGLQPAQFIVMTGLAKSCKTTIMLGLTRAVWKAGKTPLVISFEMPEPELSRRLDGFWSGINPRRLQTGELTEAEWRKLENTFLGFDGAHPYIVVEDRSTMLTVSGIRAKVEQVKPDVLFIDGAYFLTDEVSRETQTPIALTNISRSLKHLAMACNIAVVITTQALPHKVGRGGMNMYSAGYTSAWAQDADVLLGTEAVPEQVGLFKVPILASRNSQPGNHMISITWEPPEIKEIEDEDDAGLAQF